ncbi:MAG: YdcF family protein [Clostridiales bacterium]|nr:YdcF family protein [Clostridiales bacterium]MDD7550805.1 ElyC/SanA/YdcF family protein [Clostridia bacterium]MDY5754500.1 ElyC/SanA/YdcF family protein [Eubacteriales bacterium]
MAHPNTRRLIVIIIASLLAALFLLFAVINIIVLLSAQSRIVDIEEAKALGSFDCILVLGAGVWRNNRPSHVLEDRLKIGIEAYCAGVSDKLLMSGDHGRNNYDEVNVMKSFAMDCGIPSENIFMDHAGFSTYESMYRARDVFSAHRVLIVTQKFHMYRALYIANALGLEAYGLTSDLREYANATYSQLRESLARVKDFFMVIFKPLPTYLGEVLPVNGNGNVTND